MLKRVLDEYLGITLFVATAVIVIYVFRDKILSAIQGAVAGSVESLGASIYGKTPEQINADFATVKNTSVTEIASNIWQSFNVTGPASQSEYQANIAAQRAALIAAGNYKGPVYK